jgi:hypothetical protein
MANNNTFMVANVPPNIKDFGSDRTYVIAPDKIYKKTID